MKNIFILCLLFLLSATGCNSLAYQLKQFAVKGIDVSHYQEYINWDSVSHQKLDFVFVKATEGITLSDSLFENNWQEINRVGLRRGAYHFFRPSFSAEQQALNFIRNVPLDNGDLPPVLDVEVLDGASKIEVLAGMYTWLYMVEIAYGVKPVIYTNQIFYNTYLAGHFTDYPLWIARYNVRQPKLADGRKWNFWQYGDGTNLPGIAGKVDFNVFHGSAEELEHMCIRPKPILSAAAPRRSFFAGWLERKGS